MAAVRVIVLWLLLVYLVTSVTGNIVVRPNVGVLFVPAPAPRPAVLHWRHTFAIPLNLSVSDNTTNTLACPDSTSICSNLLAMANLHHATSVRVARQLLSTKDQIVALMSSPKTNRMKRGWLNIVGKGAKSLFGLATEEDINIIKHHIVKLQSIVKNGNSNRVSDIKQLHSFQLKASDRMDKLANHLTNYLIN